MTATLDLPRTSPRVKAWIETRNRSLGAHGPRALTDVEVRRLAREVVAIAARYAITAKDTAEQRHAKQEQADAAFEITYRLMVEDPKTVLNVYGHAHGDAMRMVRNTKAALRQAAALTVVVPGPGDPRPEGIHGQSGFGRETGMDRVTISRWVHGNE